LGWRVGTRRLDGAGLPSVAWGCTEVGRVPDWAVAMSEDHSGAVRGGATRGAVDKKGMAVAGAKVGICTSSALVVSMVLGMGRGAIVGTSTGGPEGGRDGKTELIGTAVTGIWSSSSSDDIGSRWVGFLHLDYFSALIQHFRAFMPSVSITVH